MSLIDFGNESDPWLSEHEACERLYRDIVEHLNSRNVLPKASDNYASASASIRIKMIQYRNEVQRLKDNLDSCISITFEEAERRHRLIENLESKNIQLNNIFTDRNGLYSGERSQLLGESSSLWAHEEDDVRRPLLSQDEKHISIQVLNEQKGRMLREQEAGLDNLSQVISRQKNIAVQISTEVNLHSELVDEIGEKMDRTSTGVQRETTNVAVVSSKDTTWGYWLIIISLFVAIIVVSIV